LDWRCGVSGQGASKAEGARLVVRMDVDNKEYERDAWPSRRTCPCCKPSRRPRSLSCAIVSCMFLIWQGASPCNFHQLHSSRKVELPPAMLSRMKFFFFLACWFFCISCNTSLECRVATFGLSATGAEYFGCVPRTRYDQ